MLSPVQVVRALGPIDAKSLWRDPLLGWTVVFPFGLALLTRAAVPPFGAWLAARYGVDLVAYYPLLTSLLILVVPAFLGTVFGFLLLDQRDDGTLTALLVTPLTLGGFLAYRTATPMLLSVLMTLLVVPLAGLTPIGFGPTLIAAVVAVPVAPFYALLLSTFAANKVQGFALSKMAGVLIWPSMFAYAVPSAWQWGFGVIPLYWPVKTFWMLAAGDRGVWLVVTIGLLYQSAVVALLLRRYGAVAGR